MGKGKFSFTWTQPCLDWFTQKNVELEEKTYMYYKLERRFGPSWWVIGINFIEEPNYDTKETQIGEISLYDLKKFIEWCKDDNGSKIIKVSAICGSFDIINEIKGL